MPDLAQITKALAGRAEHYDRTASFPADSIAAIHDAGLLTATVHRRYDGRGAGLAETAVILRALGQGDPSAALITAMTMFAHALQGIEPTWPDDVYATALAEAARRPVLINALRVEPELGTPARGGLPATVRARTAAGGRSPGTRPSPPAPKDCAGWWSGPGSATRRRHAGSWSAPTRRASASSAPGTTSACALAAATTCSSRTRRPS